MSNLGFLTRACFYTANSSRHSVGRATHAGLFIATISATLLYASSAALSGPCTVQIAHLETQIHRTAQSRGSGPTAQQSIGAQLHHQPTPAAVQNAESKANTDADAALQRARQADAAGDAVACATALGNASHHWIILLG
jgi:hypothetical protein